MGAFDSELSPKNSFFNQMTEELSPMSTGSQGSFEDLDINMNKKKSSFSLHVKKVERNSLEESSRRRDRTIELMEDDYEDEAMEEEPNYKFGGGN